MNKQEKQDRVDALRLELAGIDGMVIAENQGLTVGDIQKLRAAMRKVDGTVRVVKNNLARLSIKDTSLEVVSDKLVGPVLISFGPDLAGPAKAMILAAKELPKLVITGGCIAGRALSPDQVKALSELPGKDQMRAMLLGTFNAVPTKFVGTLAGVSRGLLNVLSARKEQLGSPAGADAPAEAEAAPAEATEAAPAA